MEAGRFPDDDWQLWITLRNAAHKTARIRNDELRKYGISFIQAAILYIVKNADVPVTPSEISRLMDREPQTVTEILNRMHRSGLINRVKDLAKRNQVRIELTEKGEQAYGNSSGLASIHKILSHLSIKEKQSLKKYLKKIDEAADEYSNDLP